MYACERARLIRAVPSPRIMLLVIVTMIAFAGNSLLCRLALSATGIDPASFTTIRLLSGSMMLVLLVWRPGRRSAGKGNWKSAAALFAYASLFSFAYLSLSAATGALLLFGAVQATMIGFGLWSGERLNVVQVAGFIIALLGLVFLLLPGLTAPPLIGAALMIGAGVAWGIYSLRGRGQANPARVTAGNFLLAVPMALILSLLFLNEVDLDATGVGLAVASGALASGLGYAVWYTVLPQLEATRAATIQLSVPVLTALGGIAFLGESLSIRLVVASIAILGGIAIVLRPAMNMPGRSE